MRILDRIVISVTNDDFRLMAPDWAVHDCVKSSLAESTEFHKCCSDVTFSVAHTLMPVRTRRA